MGSAADALVAEASGARRVELCADLGQGGTTPSLGQVAVALERLSTASVRVMIRPRGGDFVWESGLLAVAMADIAAISALPNPSGLELGFVLGALTPGRELDTATMATLLEACGSHPVVLHKAFDEVSDQFRALDEAMNLGFTTVLTSGGQPTALEGAARLRALGQQAGGLIEILVGGRVRPDNVAEVLARTAARAVHLRAPIQVHGTECTDPAVVAAVVAETQRVAQEAQA